MSEKLTSPFPHLNDNVGDPNYGENIYAKLPANIYNFFFKKVYVGERGVRQTIIQTLFKRLYDQCQSEHIEPDFTSEPVVNAIILRLNFTSHQPRPERPVRAGRADKSAAKSPHQPKNRHSVGGGVTGTGQKVKDVGNVSPDVVG